MENQNPGAQDTPSSVVPLWEVLSANLEVIQPSHTEEVVDISKDNVDQSAATEPAATDKPADKPEEVVKTDDKPVDKSMDKPADKPADATAEDVLEFTAKDVEGAPEQFKEDSWQQYAQDLLGTKIETDSYEEFQKALKENYVSKAEAEKIKTDAKEVYFKSLKPEVATALELIELGLPDHLALNPTKEIDEFLALDNTELVRKEYESIEGMTPELIDAAIEEDIANGKIDTKAGLLRVTLNNNKKGILNEQTQLIQKYTTEKQQAVQRQKQEQTSQITEALNNVSNFLTVNISPDAKKAIVHKLNSGEYDNLLNDRKSMAELILYKEFGEKYAKLLQDKALAKGKAEIVSKLSNIPPKQSQSGSRVIDKGTNDNQNQHPLSNIPVIG